MANEYIQLENAVDNLLLEDGTSVLQQESGGAGGGGPSVTPFGLQMLDNQFGPVAAATLNGVMQQ